MEEALKKLQELVKNNYKQYSTSWTAARSRGNYDDCFEDGCESGRSWLAYEVGSIIGMELEEPDEPDYDDY